METLIQVGQFAPELQATIDREFRCVAPEQAFADDQVRRTIRGLITRSVCTIEPGLLGRFPALQVLSTCGVGYDGIPLADAAGRGIVVTNTPGVLDAAVCELGIGLLLSLLRDIPGADRHVRGGDWQRGAFRFTDSLQGLRVGIVGLGRIGQGIARRLQAFDVTIAYADAVPQAVPWNHHLSVADLARESDVLVICCKGGPETHHLIDAAVLQALGAGWVVNISRGSIVDEQALCRALQAGTLRGAALDVFEAEPLGDSVLRQLPNVLLSPHAASGTRQTRAQMLRLTLDNLHAVLAGRPALTPVTA
jgi:lactate dehydrogenase-like 2-hydroxyacid dehydrogenase